MKLYQFIVGNKTEKKFTNFFVHMMTIVILLFAFCVFVATLLHLLGVNFYDLGMEILYISSLIDFVGVSILIIGAILIAKLLVRINP